MKLDQDGDWETEGIPTEDALRILTQGLNNTKDVVIQLAAEIEDLKNRR